MNPHLFWVMHTCVRLCPCWPRHDEPPFSAVEQKFLAAGANVNLGTLDFMACMDVMATWVGKDRLAYLLSVPVTWRPPGSWTVVTPWVRLDTLWTLDPTTAVMFARKMLQHGACLAMSWQEGACSQPGWVPGSSRHPGRAASNFVHRDSPLSSAVSRQQLACREVLRSGIEQRARQQRRWDARRARVRWVVTAVGGLPGLGPR
jgi:hypothetical protein